VIQLAMGSLRRREGVSANGFAGSAKASGEAWFLLRSTYHRCPGNKRRGGKGSQRVRMAPLGPQKVLKIQHLLAEATNAVSESPSLIFD
jgi:hypothetical protein